MAFGYHHALTDTQSAQLNALVDVYRTSMASDPDARRTISRDDARALATALDDTIVAEEFYEELQDAQSLGQWVMEFVEDLVTAAELPESVGLAWLRVHALDRAERSTEAIALAEQFATDECTHRPLQLAMAGFLADSGDARAALRLVNRGTGDLSGAATALTDEVTPFVGHQRGSVGRNEPCPCGSGRKYKSCHLGNEEPPLDARASLFDKALRYVSEHDARSIVTLAGAIVDPNEDRELFSTMLRWPLLRDIALHEGGLFQEFLDARATLLPADELELGAQWTATERGLFEVLDPRTRTMRLRDVRTQAVITVEHDLPLDLVSSGTTMIGRPLPVGDRLVSYGEFMPVPDDAVDDLLAAIDRHDVAFYLEVLSRMLGIDAETNTDGDDLEPLTLTWQVADPAAVGLALTGIGFAEVAEGQWEYVRDTVERDDAIVALVDLDDTELRVEVNSVERAEELTVLIEGALPDATDRQVESVDPDDPDSLDLADLAGGLTAKELGFDPSAVTPELRATLDELARRFEERWVDEPIPTFGDLTPRELVGTPEGRATVEGLLAAFPAPSPDAIVDLNADRIRGILGL